MGGGGGGGVEGRGGVWLIKAYKIDGLAGASVTELLVFSAGLEFIIGLKMGKGPTNYELTFNTTIMLLTEMTTTDLD